VDSRLVDEFLDAANSPGDDLAAAALLIARVAYPRLDPLPWLERIEEMGRTARAHLELGVGGDPPRRARLRVLGEFIYGQLGFVGNREQYDDPRNSFLNDVISRRTGIPITLAVVFLEVARRAGVALEGVNFPGHFLLRCPPVPGDAQETEALLLDPFHGGAVLSEDDCLRLLRTHTSADAVLDPAMLATAHKRDILLRMLLNLKRAYVRMHSFPQAHQVSMLLVALEPAALDELRDRGLLASQVRNYAGALRDLETWLRLAGPGDDDDEARETHSQVWNHVKSLRRRLASWN
jgi:regulator of sirC expression with transglutaminase-like and TPR domain